MNKTQAEWREHLHSAGSFMSPDLVNAISNQSNQIRIELSILSGNDIRLNVLDAQELTVTENATFVAFNTNKQETVELSRALLWRVCSVAIGNLKLEGLVCESCTLKKLDDGLCEIQLGFQKNEKALL